MRSIARAFPVILLALLYTIPASAELIYFQSLAGPWRATTEDSPAMASPDFDDRGWPVVNMPLGRAILGRGFRTEYTWIRRTVELPPEAVGQALTLTVGHAALAYEVFLNGRLIGEVAPDGPLGYPIPRPRNFDFTPQPNERRLVIAIHSARGEPTLGVGTWAAPDEGPWLISSAQAAPRDAGIRGLERHRLRRMQDFAQPIVLFCLAFVSWLIWSREPGRRTVLWLALLLTLEAAMRIWSFVQINETATPFRYPVLLSTLRVLLPMALLAQLSHSLLPFPRWIVAMVWCCAAARMLLNTFAWYQVFFAVAQVFTFAGLLYGLTRAFSRRNLLLAAALCAVIYGAGTRAGVSFPGLPVIDEVGYVGNFRLSLYPLVLGAFGLAMTLDLVGQLLRDREEKARLAGDLDAARTVQNLLMSAGSTPGVDAVYEPAQTVGGDFYFIDHPTAGKPIIAVGDVSGKGLKAAMVVSMIIGALRNRRAESPSEILAELNALLAGTLDGGFVTAVVIQVDHDGTALVANAGHPSPYMGGREMLTEPGLPLGVTPDAEYCETAFTLDSQVTLLSDGVPEAAGPGGELFGFDRTREISGKPAREIAEAARAWGQNDDITVVTVRRTVA